MRVQEQILSPRYGGPIIGAIHDYVTAAHLLTRKDTLIEREDAWQLLLAGNYEGELPRPAIQFMENDQLQEFWGGKQIFSLMLPSDTNISTRTRTCRADHTCTKEACESDDYLIIRNGVLYTGTIDRKAIGADESESVLHVVVKDHGSDRAREFIDSLMQLLLKYLSHIGFSMGFSNIVIPDDAKRQIRIMIEKTERKVEELIEAFENGQLSALPGKTLRETLEMKIMGELSKVRDNTGAVSRRHLGMDNTAVIMATTGARGTPLSITQMAACVGQQSIRGERILRGYRNFSLPHFKRGDIKAAARGFVSSNYREGLDPIEFFFHAMGGREGLVDTAVRTSTSGYLQRRLVNALQDLYVNYDYAVRTAEGEIVQLLYGEDGVDPMKSFHGKAVDIDAIADEVLLYRDKNATETFKFDEFFIKEEISKYRFPDNIQKELFDKILMLRDISREDIIKIANEVYESFQRSLAEPGEAIGTVAAQSIGEPGTQMTLKTFHFAGVAELNVTIGLPRLIEILDARKNPASPYMKIYMDEVHAKDSEKAKEIQQKIELTTVDKISSNIAVDMAMMRIQVLIDPELMEDKGVTPELIIEKLQKLKKGEITFKDNIITIEAGSTDIDELYKLQEKVQETQLKGIKDISKVILVKEPTIGEWVLYSEGSNLAEVISVPGVDPTRISTNNLQEILETLGVEAARSGLVREAMQVLEEQGLEVDIRHIILVADLMTQHGNLRQIGRHGISGEKESVLAKASFEVTVKHLLESAAYGKLDQLRGITENVIIGQIIPVGTGTVELIMMPGQAGRTVTEEQEQEDVEFDEDFDEDFDF
ncbi:MAG: DNA-directed RNA polymerase subunit A'' [Candidatus Hodarchaeales archaeon]